uniref:Uncharacterized protein n=1 Tax=Avena sativa TaxID=4498 RepID=A0ACD5WV21_AVESA
MWTLKCQTILRNRGGHTNLLVICVDTPPKQRDVSFSKRIWAATTSWLSCPDLLLCLGSGRPKVLDYWHAIAKTPTSSLKGLQTAIILIVWEIWKERNERVFGNRSSLPSVIMDKIREEEKDWILAGAKNLAELVG